MFGWVFSSDRNALLSTCLFVFFLQFFFQFSSLTSHNIIVFFHTVRKQKCLTASTPSPPPWRPARAPATSAWWSPVAYATSAPPRPAPMNPVRQRAAGRSPRTAAGGDLLWLRPDVVRGERLRLRRHSVRDNQHLRAADLHSDETNQYSNANRRCACLGALRACWPRQSLQPRSPRLITRRPCERVACVRG